jgi:hypothetical protein
MKYKWKRTAIFLFSTRTQATSISGSPISMSLYFLHCICSLFICRLEKLEMWDAQTSHLGQVVQIFFWRTTSRQTHQIRLVYTTDNFFKRLVFVEYGLFSGFFMNKFACTKKMVFDIFLIFCQGSYCKKTDAIIFYRFEIVIFLYCYKNLYFKICRKMVEIRSNCIRFFAIASYDNFVQRWWTCTLPIID